MASDFPTKQSTANVKALHGDRIFDVILENTSDNNPPKWRAWIVEYVECEPRIIADHEDPGSHDTMQEAFWHLHLLVAREVAREVAKSFGKVPKKA